MEQTLQRFRKKTVLPPDKFWVVGWGRENKVSTWNCCGLQLVAISNNSVVNFCFLLEGGNLPCVISNHPL